jgi:predicted DNA-binding transcriptional regulator YafY
MPAKIDPYNSAGAKLLGLYILLLFNQRPYSLKHLAELFTCSKQTILRMVEQIEMRQEVRLESWVKDRQRYFQIMPPKGRPNICLSPDDIRQLILCRDMVRHLLPKELREQLQTTIGAAAMLLRDGKPSAREMQSFAESMGRGLIDYSGHRDTINTINKAMMDSRVLTVEYRSRLSNPVKTYTVAPLRLLAYHEALYLRCWPLTDTRLTPKEKCINLAIQRIVSVRMRKETHDISLEPEEAATHFGFVFNDPFRVKMEFSPAVATYISERTWSSDQKAKLRKDGSLLLEFTTVSRPELIAWALSFGAEARIIEPANIRNEVRKLAQATARHYAETGA